MPDMPLFKDGGIHVAASLVPHRRKSQLPYILNVQKAGEVPRYCITKHDSVHVGPFKAMGFLLIGPVSRLWECCLS